MPSTALHHGPEVGIDEAGRGPWAGPVCVAAVRLHPDRPIAGLNDSKALTEKRREALFPVIQEHAAAWSIQFLSASQIDASDILRATFAGMRDAAVAVWVPSLEIWVDGDKVPPGLPGVGKAIVKGDGKIAAIAAASILAKVARDHYMEQADKRFPGYGFAKHKGYGTEAHHAALRALGPCPEHRLSFKPVAAVAAARV